MENYQSLFRKSLTKNKKTEDIIGCSYDDFKLYIESKFEPWMNWDNYGLYNSPSCTGWDLDHIVPIFSNYRRRGYKFKPLYKFSTSL